MISFECGALRRGLEDQIKGQGCSEPHAGKTFATQLRRTFLQLRKKPCQEMCITLDASSLSWSTLSLSVSNLDTACAS